MTNVTDFRRPRPTSSSSSMSATQIMTPRCNSLNQKGLVLITPTPQPGSSHPPPTHLNLLSAFPCSWRQIKRPHLPATASPLDPRILSRSHRADWPTAINTLLTSHFFVLRQALLRPRNCFSPTVTDFLSRLFDVITAHLPQLSATPLLSPPSFITKPTA